MSTSTLDAATLTASVRDQAALLDVQAVAALLDCSPRHVYRLADAGRMPPPVRIGALRSWPHSGHSYKPSTTSGREESECMVRSRIGTIDSCRSQAGASSKVMG